MLFYIKKRINVEGGKSPFTIRIKIKSDKKENSMDSKTRG